MATNNSKITVLNRMLHMLEENSVVALTSNDPAFRSFITNIYYEVEHKVSDLANGGRP